MGVGVSELLVILIIVVIVFGTKKLRNLGSDLGGAIKNFRVAMKEGEEDNKSHSNDDVIEGQVSAKDDKKD